MKGIKFLVLINLVFPIGCLIVAADRFNFNGAIKNALPSSPFSIVWFAIIFTFPHVFASLSILNDRAYYHLLVKRALPILALSCVCYFLLKESYSHYLISFFLLYTSIHFFNQQQGIILILEKPKSVMFYNISKYAGVLCVAFEALTIFLTQSGNQESVINFLYIALGVNLLAQLVAFSWTTHLWKTLFKLLPQILLFSTYLFIHFKYYFLVYFCARIVHDITAFHFYILHDIDRNKQGFENNTLKAMSFFKVPSYLAHLILGLLCSVLVYLTPWFELLSFIFGVTHFFMEGFMWKGSHSLRSHIKL